MFKTLKKQMPLPHLYDMFSARHIFFTISVTLRTSRKFPNQVVTFLSSVVCIQGLLFGMDYHQSGLKME